MATKTPLPTAPWPLTHQKRMPHARSTHRRFRSDFTYACGRNVAGALRHIWGERDAQHARHLRLYRTLMQRAGTSPRKREQAHAAMMRMLAAFIHDSTYRLNYIMLGALGFELDECDMCGCGLKSKAAVQCQRCEQSLETSATFLDTFRVLERMKFERGGLHLEHLISEVVRPEDMYYNEMRGALHLVGHAWLEHRDEDEDVRFLSMNSNGLYGCMALRLTEVEKTYEAEMAVTAEAEKKTLAQWARVEGEQIAKVNQHPRRK